MKKTILMTALFLQACSPSLSLNKKMSFQNETPVEIINNDQKTSIDGEYNYDSILCFDESNTTIKKTIKNQAYEYLSINNGKLYSRIGYTGSSTPTHIELSGEVVYNESLISISSLKINSSTHPEWMRIGGYKTGILNYPNIIGAVEFSAGMNLQNVNYDNFTIGENKDIYVYLPNNNQSLGASSNDKCYLFYQKTDTTNISQSQNFIF